MIAVRLALEDAERFGAVDAAMLMAITHGALCYTEEFHRGMINGGGAAASPLLFSDSVLNAAAGNASICFNMKGPVHTLVGGPSTSLKAIVRACRMIGDGLTDSAIVASAEELNGLSSACYYRLGKRAFGEGAGAVFIEKEGVSRLPYCIIRGAASFCDPSEPESALDRAVSSSLLMAGLVTDEIDLLMTDVPSHEVCRSLKDVPAWSIIPFTGDAHSVNALWHIILAAVACKAGSLPGSFLARGTSSSGVINNILVCSLEKTGAASSVIVSRCR